MTGDSDETLKVFAALVAMAFATTVENLHPAVRQRLRFALQKNLVALAPGQSRLADLTSAQDEQLVALSELLREALSLPQIDELWSAAEQETG